MPVASVFRSLSLSYLLLSLLFLSNIVESYSSSARHSSAILDKRIDGEDYRQYRNVIEYNKRDENGTLTCNDREDICDLGYDQVTHIGTHNSGAYDLAFDCDQVAATCLDSSTTCTRQLSSCLSSYPLYCSAAATVCKQWHPSWSHFLCDGFDAICKKTDFICYMWEGICSDTTNVCALWGDACENGPPEWFLGCLWENNAGMDVLRQLEDGIRYLDLDTCQTGNTVVICHGMGLPRALGHSLDNVLPLIRSFLLSHPNEVVSLGFGDIDGNATFMSEFIQNKLAEYFIFPNGTSLLLSRPDDTQPWPTLREMIESNSRVVVWFEWLYDDFGTQKREDWIHSEQYWMTKSFDYTNDATTAQKLNDSFMSWCGNADNVIAYDIANFGRLKWQIVDDVVSYDPGQIVTYLQSRTIPANACLQTQASLVNYGTLDFLADFCMKKFGYIFRLTVDYYWQSNLFEVAKKMNDWNVERVKSLGSNL